MNKYMMPLWMKFPSYPNGCIGWRMGDGEGYVDEIYAWFKTLSDEDKVTYGNMFHKPQHWDAFKEKRIKYIHGYLGIIFWTENGEPAYTKDKLIKEMRNGEEKEFLFFYGHQPSKNGSITKSCFSQWWETNFKVGSLSFPTVEHYMMMSKAELFKDEDVSNQIKGCQTPREAKALGRKVSNFDNKIWDEVKHSIVLNGNYWKFANNSTLMEFLLSTGDKIIVEASPNDKIWGIGMSEHDEGVDNPVNWKGENMLGFALMEVRDEIRQVYKNSDKTY